MPNTVEVKIGYKFCRSLGGEIFEPWHIREDGGYGSLCNLLGTDLEDVWNLDVSIMIDRPAAVCGECMVAYYLRTQVQEKGW